MLGYMVSDVEKKDIMGFVAEYLFCDIVHFELVFPFPLLSYET